MNQRPDIEELLIDYIDGTLDPARKQEVESMLSSDAELRNSVLQMMRGRDALKALPVERAPAQVTHSIAQTIAAPPARRWLFQFSATRLAAALLLSVSLGVAIWALLPRGQREPMAAGVQARPVTLALKESLDKESDSERFEDRAMAKAGPAPAAVLSPQVAVQPAKPAESMYASAASNASALMYVRASDIPAVQREIEQLASSNRIPQSISNASPEMALQPLRKQAADQAREDELKVTESKSEKPATPSVSGFAKSDALAPEKPTILLNNVTPEQVRLIEQNVMALNPTNEVQIVSPSPQGQAQVGAELQSLPSQQQMVRSMPSATPADLQEFARMRQQRELRQNEQLRDTARYDLTIILEPQPLPAAGPPATLPATVPTRP